MTIDKWEEHKNRYNSLGPSRHPGSNLTDWGLADFALGCAQNAEDGVRALIEKISLMEVEISELRRNVIKGGME